MLAGMTSVQVSEWMAFASIFPIGERRADWRMAVLASIILNVNRDPEKTKPVKPADLLPAYDTMPEDDLVESPRQPVAAQIGLANIFAEAGLGVVTHGNNS